MQLSYNNLWKLLIDRNIKKQELKEATGLGSTTMTKLNNNQLVSMEVMMKICFFLQCDIGVCRISGCSAQRAGDSKDSGK